MSRVVHFEYAAEDPETMADFYSHVLGWTIRKWEGPVDYWLISTGPENEPGIHGGMARKENRQVSGPLVSAAVQSIDETLKNIVLNGGDIVLPKRAIPGVGYQAHFRDPEGNVTGILEYDPNAR